MAATTRPILSVQIAFGAAPFTALSSVFWTDVTSDVRLAPDQNGSAIAIRRGRANELTRVEAGTLSLTLDNRTRKYDTENASGPYYGSIKPMNRIQVRAVWASTTYTLFTGYVQAYAPEYPGGQDAVVRVRAVDALAAVARTTITYTAAGLTELMHYAIQSALVQIGWPTADYTFSNAQTRIGTGTYANLNGLQHIQAIADTEDGLVFARHDGKIEFQDRYYRIKNNTSAATFGTSGAELPYEGVQLSYDEETIYNDVQVTRQGGTLQEAVDTTSNSAYGPRVLSKSGLYFETDNEALSMAQWFLLRYKDPKLRFPQLTLNGDLSSTALWPQILDGGLSRKVTVVVRPPGGGSINKDARVEGITHTIDRGTWRCAWALSLVSDDTFWVIGTSALGTTTQLAF